MAMLGVTSYTKVPLRLATLLGFASAAFSFLIGSVYLVYKLVNWANFSLGLAPVVIGLFFLGRCSCSSWGSSGSTSGRSTRWPSAARWSSRRNGSTSRRW